MANQPCVTPHAVISTAAWFLWHGDNYSIKYLPLWLPFAGCILLSGGPSKYDRKPFKHGVTILLARDAFNAYLYKLTRSTSLWKSNSWSNKQLWTISFGPCHLVASTKSGRNCTTDNRMDMVFRHSPQAKEVFTKQFQFFMFCTNTTAVVKNWLEIKHSRQSIPSKSSFTLMVEGSRFPLICSMVEVVF